MFFLGGGGGLEVCCKGEGGSKKYVFQLWGFWGGVSSVYSFQMCFSEMGPT